eukprot:31721_1
MAVTQQFENYKRFGIFNDTSGDISQDHAISILGYGIDLNTKYWIGRNSWGTFWGYNGYFRITRGINNLGRSSWATSAKAAVWVNTTNDKPIINEYNDRKYMRGAERPPKNDWKKK